MSHAETAPAPASRSLNGFFIVVAALLIARLALGFVPVPEGLLMPLRVVAVLAFIGLPIFGLYLAAGVAWTARPAWIFLGVGVALHVGGVLATRALGGEGAAAVVLAAIGQTGILLWCLGLGVLLAILIKDKNLMLPVAIFLVGFDMFLVFSPSGLTQRIVQENPELFQSVAASVPDVQVAEPAGAPPAPRVSDLANVGPADLFFITTFLTCLYRFGMNVRKTVTVLAPVMAVYMGLVLAGAAMLPALVPVGAVVLGVNWREFKMNREEQIGTALAAVVAALLAGSALWQRSQPAPEPIPEEAGITLPPGQ